MIYKTCLYTIVSVHPIDFFLVALHVLCDVAKPLDFIGFFGNDLFSSCAFVFSCCCGGFCSWSSWGCVFRLFCPPPCFCCLAFWLFLWLLLFGLRVFTHFLSSLLVVVVFLPLHAMSFLCVSSSVCLFFLFSFLFPIYIMEQGLCILFLLFLSLYYCSLSFLLSKT